MRSRNHCHRGKPTSITHSECVFVTLVIPHTVRMCNIILSPVACLVLTSFSDYLINGMIFGIYRVIRNNCRGYNNLLYTSFSRCNPMWFLSMGLRQGSGLCTSSSRKYPGTEGTNQNRHWNHHRWHATNSLERTRLSCWCLQNHKRCTYRAPIRYVTKTWSVVLLNKKNTYTAISSVLCMTSC